MVDHLLAPIFIVPICLLIFVGLIVGLLLISYAASLLNELEAQGHDEREEKDASPVAATTAQPLIAHAALLSPTLPFGMAEPAPNRVAVQPVPRQVQQEVVHGRLQGQQYRRWKPCSIYIGPYLMDVSLFEVQLAAPLCGPALN